MQTFDDFALDAKAKERLEIYAHLLLEWNQTHNLSGVKDLSMVVENIFDSIYPLKFIHPFRSCLDIGSGAGFPGLVLAICKPTLRFVLVEPRAKRAAFLQYASVAMGLDGVVVQKCLIEDLKLPKNGVQEKVEAGAQGEMATGVDLITSRAVMGSCDLIDRGKRFLNKNGYYLFYKGSNLVQEIACEPDERVVRGSRVYFYRQETQKEMR
ncbi:16S rRNA (guanine(527)-N(7))-methyltransferase RsmG [Helicobacter sp. 11S02596-1]|uniref:16S rRNA (guanine(527)-N(7))-methyltransferase RsmG n=1 Tax=Helicobacter sp. 11S02596-1 TaxID=1476194 RepID=UPI000BA696DE|nr:16S rRNA (guanine(527)-N(7))-methyltransferase RsmG [Helicobacter sp. 11S02596-1]PAF42515.1 16S rRNA (guanine(527)-N(7))-methyltransferase RsmG [Helicobacter sp. 11S02596-1]